MNRNPLEVTKVEDKIYLEFEVFFFFNDGKFKHGD